MCRAVNAAHPHLLQTNIDSTCFEFVTHVISQLVANGIPAFYICKTRGEGQFIPPGFQPRDIGGLDGKPVLVTGFSHDAIWFEENGVLNQADLVGGGNDSHSSIGTPGTPTWNEIPQQFWRSSNPPYREVEPVPAPSIIKVPGYEELGGDVFFRANVGVPLEADMTLAGVFLNEGSSVWFSRTIYDVIVAFLNKKQAEVPAIIKKHRNEWRRILGLPEIP